MWFVRVAPRLSERNGGRAKTENACWKRVHAAEADPYQPASGGGCARPLQDIGIGRAGLRILHLFVLQGARFLRAEGAHMEFAQPLISPIAPPHLAKEGSCARLVYRIGGISFGLYGGADLNMNLEPGLREFVVESGACDVQIHVEWADELEMPAAIPSFHSGGLWSVYAATDGHQFCFNTPILGPEPYKLASFNGEFTIGRVALQRQFFDPHATVFPMEYPLDELLMIHRLSLGEGVEVHAVGIVDESGRGHLFLGHSGAGKSTTARLWDTQPAARILSDDRIILRAHSGAIWMYGTPWHGDAGVALPECAPLSRMYLLEHAPSNQLVPMPRGQAAAELFARCFVPYHLACGLEFALSFVDRVAQSIPCSLFRFVPDISAVETISRAED